MTIDEQRSPDREILGWHEFGEASRELAAQVHESGFVPDMVVAIARGGLLLAGSVAYALDVKSCGAINVEFYTGVDLRLDEPMMLSPMLDTPAVAGHRVLLVDDVSDSGRTLAMVLALLLTAEADVRSLCLYSKPKTLLEPDYVWRKTSKWIAFPWSSLPPVTV
ncbi:phosphoribosyltransferase [Glaciihabitans sp. GrIS 2.15]|uniref:phosphoribosyltransferase n=1 Tax=Glaciihabitans sp. GrIS 2.15 TaxID=3071710 RepID=UPI0019AC5D35|nr:phosphoribosyltransferase [Microbacteriaceae bacterium]MEC5170748.1 hypoxanthine phosphoribosyltransferase [Glaciihabitans sp. GrIS 2.15]